MSQQRTNKILVDVLWCFCLAAEKSATKWNCLGLYMKDCPGSATTVDGWNPASTSWAWQCISLFVLCLLYILWIFFARGFSSRSNSTTKNKPKFSRNKLSSQFTFPGNNAVGDIHIYIYATPPWKVYRFYGCRPCKQQKDFWGGTQIQSKQLFLLG